MPHSDSPDFCLPPFLGVIIASLSPPICNPLPFPFAHSCSSPFSSQIAMYPHEKTKIGRERSFRRWVRKTTIQTRLLFFVASFYPTIPSLPSICQPQIPSRVFYLAHDTRFCISFEKRREWAFSSRHLFESLIRILPVFLLISFRLVSMMG